MRDPNRIPIILALIEQIWKMFPDLRLGQMLVTLAGNRDIFYVEDDKLEANLVDGLEFYIKKARGEKKDDGNT